MHNRFKMVLLAALITCPAAFAMTDAPKKCPGIEAIKQVPFTRAQTDYWLGWIAATPASKYDTENEWVTGIIIGKIEDESESKVISKANSLLPFLQPGTATPQKQDGAYWCAYQIKTSNDETFAYSYTPAYEGLGKFLAKMHK